VIKRIIVNRRFITRVGRFCQSGVSVSPMYELSSFVSSRLNRSFTRLVPHLGANCVAKRSIALIISCNRILYHFAIFLTIVINKW
jgi:hypothetical protein